MSNDIATAESPTKAQEALKARMLLARWLRLVRSIQAVSAPGGRAVCAFNAQELAEALAIHLGESEEVDPAVEAHKPGGIREHLHEMLG